MEASTQLLVIGVYLIEDLDNFRPQKLYFQWYCPMQFIIDQNYTLSYCSVASGWEYGIVFANIPMCDYTFSTFMHTNTMYLCGCQFHACEMHDFWRNPSNNGTMPACCWWFCVCSYIFARYYPKRSSTCLSFYRLSLSKHLLTEAETDMLCLCFMTRILYLYLFCPFIVG